MGTEEELQQLCLETLRDEHYEPERVQVDSQVPIIKDCTFVPEDGDFTLYFGAIQREILFSIGHSTRTPINSLRTTRSNPGGKTLRMNSISHSR